MPRESRKVSLIVFVILTLLLVGLVPLVLTGWLLSDKSGRELRSAENRYQIQLVQEKASQIEIFGRRFTSIVESLATAVEITENPAAISSAQTDAKLEQILRENKDLAALYVKPAAGEAFSVFRAETLSRAEVDRISSNVAVSQSKGKVSIGDPQRAAVSGQFVMPFASEVKIGGEVSGQG